MFGGAILTTHESIFRRLGVAFYPRSRPGKVYSSDNILCIRSRLNKSVHKVFWLSTRRRHAG